MQAISKEEAARKRQRLDDVNPPEPARPRATPISRNFPQPSMTSIEDALIQIVDAIGPVVGNMPSAQSRRGVCDHLLAFLREQQAAYTRRAEAGQILDLGRFSSDASTGEEEVCPSVCLKRNEISLVNSSTGDSSANNSDGDRVERIEGRLGAADSGYGPPCRDIENEAAVTHVTGRGASTSGPVGAPFDVNASFDELLCELRSMHSFTTRANCLASLILNHPNYPGSLETICATKDVVKLGNYVSGRINVYIFIPRRRDPRKDTDPYEWVDRRPLVLSLSKKNTGEPAPLEELRKVRAKFDGSRYVLKPYSPGHFPCTIQHSK